MKNLQRFAAIIFLSMLLLACSDGTNANTDSPASTGASSEEIYPPMGLVELDQYLAANKGKPTMLMFWTTWCPSCKQAFPDLVKLAQTHGDLVNVITVSLDESRDVLTGFYKTRKQELPVYFGDDAIAAKFDVQAIPTMVFFDKTGEPVFSRPGVFPYEMLVKAAKNLAE